MKQSDVVWVEQIPFIQWISTLADGNGRVWQATLERDLESRASSTYVVILSNHEHGMSQRSQGFFSPKAAMAWCYRQLQVQID